MTWNKGLFCSSEKKKKKRKEVRQEEEEEDFSPRMAVSWIHPGLSLYLRLF